MPSKPMQQVEEFFSHYPMVKYKKGDMIIFGGEDPAGIYYLVKGIVRQYDVTPSGDEVVVNVFQPPAFFPMSYAINRTQNDYFFDASTAVTVHRAPVEETLAFVRSNPDVIFDLLSRVLKGADGLLRRQTQLMSGNATTRLIYELVLACRRFGDTSSPGVCFIDIKEAELASRAGLTRETVNRQIHELKVRGLVTVAPNGMTINNVAALEKELDGGA